MDELVDTLCNMQRLYSMFPRGAAGAALLLLRISSASAVVLAASVVLQPSPWHLAGAAALAVLMLLGLLTPVAACLATAALTWWGWVQPAMFLVAASTAALALLGPGAYACDAWLFGRRRVLLSGRSNH